MSAVQLVHVIGAFYMNVSVQPNIAGIQESVKMETIKKPEISSSCGFIS